MDNIHEAAIVFEKLLSITYRFVIVHNRRLQTILLDFHPEDFRHIAGLHYLDDIEIESNPPKTFHSICEQKITDKMLEASDKFKSISPRIGSVQERICELRFLDKYLDCSNFIRIYKIQNFGSNIKADYFIESSVPFRQSSVYIFIRKRKETDRYVIVSFFKKHATFQGSAAYWMLKEKLSNGQAIELYRSPSFPASSI